MNDINMIILRKLVEKNNYEDVVIKQTELYDPDFFKENIIQTIHDETSINGTIRISYKKGGEL